MDLIEMFLQNAIHKKDSRLPRCVTAVVCENTMVVYLRGRVPSWHLRQLATSAASELGKNYGLRLIDEIQVAHM